MLLKGIAYYNVLIFSFFVLFNGCSSPVDLPDFDEKAWKQDVRSCQNIRPGLVAGLEKNKSLLMGLNHTDILALLGKPEGNSLEKSGERVYAYFIQQGSQCENEKTKSNAAKVLIRFDALDRVYKIKFENNI
ncbi:MAG: hypothetical protein ACO1OF_00335 [Adhaeribacter sp.]